MLIKQFMHNVFPILKLMHLITPDDLGLDRGGYKLGFEVGQGMGPTPVTHVVAVHGWCKSLTTHRYYQHKPRLKSNADQEARLRGKE
jgi:hypothetical protein